MAERNVKIIEGKLREDIYGNWSDVDRGMFIDRDCIVSAPTVGGFLGETFLDDYLNKRIRITVEVLPDEEEEEDDDDD